MSKTSDLSIESNWLSLKKDLKKIVGDSAYNNWLKHLSFVSFEETTLSFSLPTKQRFCQRASEFLSRSLTMSSYTTAVLAGLEGREDVPL